MNRKLSNWLMMIGVLLLLAAAGLAGYNYLESRHAGVMSAEVLEQMQGGVELRSPAVDAPETEESVPETLPVPEMPVAEINGHTYVGRITIPALNLELPVIYEWDYDSLQIAPCRYHGSVYTEDMVLCGHSYGTHFGYLPRLQPGDPVIFTCMDDTVFRYEVAEVEILQPTDIDGMIESGYALSLFTCTKDSQARVTVRCNAVK